MKSVLALMFVIMFAVNAQANTVYIPDPEYPDTKWKFDDMPDGTKSRSIQRFGEGVPPQPVSVEIVNESTYRIVPVVVVPTLRSLFATSEPVQVGKKYRSYEFPRCQVYVWRANFEYPDGTIHSDIVDPKKYIKLGRTVRVVKTVTLSGIVTLEAQ